MHQLLGDAQAAGAAIALRSKVVAAHAQADEIAVEVETADGESTSLLCALLVNAAGLSAPRLARQLVGLPQDTVPTAYFAKGNYFALSGKSPFSRLVYPVPEPGGLGIHFTIDLGGQGRFGPDVEWLEIGDETQINFDVDPQRAAVFYPSIRRYWPALPDGALQPSYAGVRPKIARTGDADFLIQGPATHGVAGLFNLFGIESPGLTASLAIGRHAAKLMLG
jgi:L-2-hydroxyglutarate oxidase LhgO